MKIEYLKKSIHIELRNEYETLFSKLPDQANQNLYMLVVVLRIHTGSACSYACIRQFEPRSKIIKTHFSTIITNYDFVISVTTIQHLKTDTGMFSRFA